MIHHLFGIQVNGMTAMDELLKNNARYAENFDKGDLRSPPGRKLAILACMDARLDTHKALGLAEGDAHVIRNAGGVVTDDALRSLVISQRLLGTREIVLIHHTDCGMLTFRDDEIKDAIEETPACGRHSRSTRSGIWNRMCANRLRASGLPFHTPQGQYSRLCLRLRHRPPECGRTRLIRAELRR